jgi:chemotaxis methyl-accepting protein methylase
MVERCVKNRLQASGASDLTGYLLMLENNRAELDSLLDLFTIGVSEFFRDPMVFSAIESFAFPEILRHKDLAADQSIRVWSAGCSTGEEPYSVAILLREVCLPRDTQPLLEIFGTDIDEKGIEQAQKGEYPVERLSNVRMGLFEKYFESLGERFRINKDIRDMVSFSYHDLLSQREHVPEVTVFGAFDMILCRNVLIYLDKKHQEMVLERLDRALGSGGFLVLGEAESLGVSMKKRYRRVCDFCRVFRKDRVK